VKDRLDSIKPVVLSRFFTLLEDGAQVAILSELVIKLAY
jgi:hypothetical protein